MSTKIWVLASIFVVGLAGSGAGAAGPDQTGAAATGQQQSGDSPTLMEERSGAIGTEREGDTIPPPEPAVQDGDLAGVGEGEPVEKARAATGSRPASDSLQFGQQGPDASLPAKRQGTIGTDEIPPEPVQQGGGGTPRQ